MAKTYFKNVSLAISPTQYMSAGDYLMAVYRKLGEEVPRYGVKPFSYDLGFGPNNIAYLLAHGKRSLTTKHALAVIQALQLKKLCVFSNCSDINYRSGHFKEQKHLKKLFCFL
jgi:hypothetical protein